MTHECESRNNATRVVCNQPATFLLTLACHASGHVAVRWNCDKHAKSCLDGRMRCRTCHDDRGRTSFHRVKSIEQVPAENERTPF